jgi:hypothetical protein
VIRRKPHQNLPSGCYENCLTLISGNEPLALGPADGEQTLARATDVFRYIDSNFEHWSCNVAAPPTKEAPVQVYEMVRDSIFQEMFGRTQPLCCARVPGLGHSKTSCDGADFARDVGSHLPALEHAGKIIFSVWSSRLWIDLNRSVLQGHLPRSSNCRCKRFRVRNGAKGTSNHN